LRVVHQAGPGDGSPIACPTLIAAARLCFGSTLTMGLAVKAKLLWPNICCKTRTSTPAEFALAGRAADAHRLAVAPARVR